MADRVYDFRATIQGLTCVPPIRQKLIGLTKGKLATELDSTRFGALGVKDGVKFMMVGTPEEMSFKDPSEVKLPDVSFSLPFPIEINVAVFSERVLNHDDVDEDRYLTISM